MKRKEARYRRIPAPFVRPSTDYPPDLVGLGSAIGQGRHRSNRIFVVKQTTRLQSATGTPKKLRRILIFDNHPDSLRLVFAGGANHHGDFSETQRVSSWELILVSILTLSALIAIFWPML